MGPRETQLARRLADERGHEVVLLSQCLLNANARYLGGAFHRGAVPEAARLVAEGAAVHQLPCPERCAWGGVLKPQMLRAYGLRDTALYRYRGPLFALFVLHTRWRYWLLARRVARDIADYEAAGIAVRAIVGVGASPSCGVRTTLDLRRSFETVASCPLASVDRAALNEAAVVNCRVPGEGLFVRALKRQLRRRGIDVPFVEHDLIEEMRCRPQSAGLTSLLAPPV